ncbi:carboxypeptidase-like regulatory domain-containing protein [candidate division KSB1 bacterium]|nr:carboxypeptidase-like regulatory domain-containing protein [candidate division KSB1 bacterium]
MNSAFYRYLTFAASFSLGLVVSCTESPIGGKVDNSPKVQIRGRVDLSDGVTPEGVYVWLEGTPLSTRTDKNGFFQVTLPPARQNDPTYANGVFNLYFFVANYRLNFTPVVVQNGEFAYSRGEVDKNGELTSSRHLFKLLQIKTVVDPEVVSSNYEGPVGVQAALRATLDSVTVVFPKVIGGLLGGILLKNQATGEVSIDAADAGPNLREVEKIGNEFYYKRLIFTRRRSELPPGEYEIVPYFLIQHDNMPAGLLPSLGQKVEEISPEFLKIPFKREGGRFVIGN